MTEVTWNPTTGCDRISEGCDNCSECYQADGRDTRPSAPRLSHARPDSTPQPSVTCPHDHRHTHTHDAPAGEAAPSGLESRTMTTATRTLDQALGARVHILMWEQRITQAAMGEALGKTQTTVGRKLRGDVSFAVNELPTVARLLGVKPGELLEYAIWDSNPEPRTR